MDRYLNLVKFKNDGKKISNQFSISDFLKWILYLISYNSEFFTISKAF